MCVMSFIQLIGIATAGAVVSVLLKNYRPEFAVCTAILTGVILLINIIGLLGNVISVIGKIVDAGGLDAKYFMIIMKITGISYITEIASQLCKDSGQGAVAVKIELVGKLFILMYSMPVILGFLEVCADAVNIL